jgi:hypothetical protein
MLKYLLALPMENEVLVCSSGCPASCSVKKTTLKFNQVDPPTTNCVTDITGATLQEQAAVPSGGLGHVGSD